MGSILVFPVKDSTVIGIIKFILSKLVPIRFTTYRRTTFLVESASNMWFQNIVKGHNPYSYSCYYGRVHTR